MHLIYLLILDASHCQVNHFLFLSDSTIARYKALLLDAYRVYIQQRPVLLDGLGIIVEVYECVLSRRGVVRCPEAADDAILDTVWIFGGIYKKPAKTSLVEIETRTVDDPTADMGGVVVNRNVLYTDVHSLYPFTAFALGVEQPWLNSSVGFRGDNGTHTNTIEGFWVHMKGSMRKEHGTNHNHIDDWPIQNTFKRRYVINKSN